MNTPLTYIIGSILILIILGWIYRPAIQKRLMRLSVKLKMDTLRTAIHDADADKEKTGRKNIVVFVQDRGEFAATSKKRLKRLAHSKNMPKVVKGFRQPKAKKINPLRVTDVKRIEHASPYVTK